MADALIKLCFYSTQNKQIHLTWWQHNLWMSFAVHALCVIRHIPYFPHVMPVMQMARLANAEFLSRKLGNEYCFCRTWFYGRFLFLLIHTGNNISYIQSTHSNHYNQPSKQQNLPPAQQSSSAASQTNQTRMLVFKMPCRAQTYPKTFSLFLPQS